jgi:hypothetical protein
VKNFLMMSCHVNACPDISKRNTDRYVLNQSWKRTHRLARLTTNFGLPVGGFGFDVSARETATAFSEIGAT